MSELGVAERTLWFEGANQTADAVIIDPAAAKILLVQRKDSGQWALPGGFVDVQDASTHHAAVREAAEEAAITLDGHAPQLFRGVVDDPRNCHVAWIETTAHFFEASAASIPRGGDDADDAVWHDMAQLPELYASHRDIVERALDHMDGQTLADTLMTPDMVRAVDGGHMEYDKFIHAKNGHAVFCKQHNDARFSDAQKAERSRMYLEKEAFTMAHLRVNGFRALPERSRWQARTLAMDALLPEAGWQWRAQTATIDEYVQSAVTAFAQLETMPVPADTFAIEPSYESFMREGWRALNEETLRAVTQAFLPRLTDVSRASARDLLADVPDLRQAGLQPRQPERFVFCHHDVRQSNLAWHPTHGTKLVDWSWAGLGEPGSDLTSLLVDLHKSGHDISAHTRHINPSHCLQLMGFWLGHSTWPHRGDDTVRFQQFASALSAYELLRGPK